jgi:transcriptional regulator with XRE-family HTH domain
VQGLTQRELAEKLAELDWRIDPTALTRIEKGERSVRVSQLATLGKALGVSVHQLLDPTPRTSEIDRARAEIDAAYEAIHDNTLRMLHGLRDLDEAVRAAEAAGASQNDLLILKMTLHRTTALDPVEQGILSFSSEVAADNYLLSYALDRTKHAAAKEAWKNAPGIPHPQEVASADGEHQETP